MPGWNYAGWARESIIMTPTWPSAAPALVTTLLPLLPVMDVQQGVHKQFHADGHGPVGYSQADVLSILPAFTTPLALRYGGFEPLYAAALGLEARRLGATVMPEQLAPGVYRHVFECDPGLSAMAPWQVPDDGIQAGDISAGQRKVRRGTVAAYREFGVWEWLSAMIDQMSLAWQAPSDEATCTLDCLAYRDTQTPTINTATTLARAVPNASPDVQFSHAVIRLGPYSTSTPLGEAHRLACQSASVTVQNHLESTPGPRTGLYREEPERGGSGIPLVMGSLLRPRYLENTLVAAWRENTRYMMDLKCTGPWIGDTAYRLQLNVYVPGLFFIQVEPSPLALSRSNLPVQWMAAAPEATPAGFPVTARQGPVIIETVTGSAAHTLL